METGVKAGSVVTTVEDMGPLEVGSMSVIVRTRAGIVRRSKLEGTHSLVNRLWFEGGHAPKPRTIDIQLILHLFRSIPAQF